jgi:GTP-binding protein
MKEGYAFVDYVRIHVVSGDGGNGAVSFRQEKFAPRGGPDGGDGGRGGHVILEVDKRLTTLLDMRHKSTYRAKRGVHGSGGNCSGKGGEDIVAMVPLGTVVSDEEGRFLADLTEHGQRYVAAKGGDGGMGNQHFATSRNQAPRRATDGIPGEEKTLILELKVIADVGLVGLPNAGKSTLLAALTNADPKIAPYPFTTLAPNLGVFLREDGFRRIIFADIPGLIEGAHHGAGLGDRFLRHIERTRLLVFLIADMEQKLEPEDLRWQFDLLRREMEQYSDLLVDKPFFVAVSKIDEWTEPLGADLASDFQSRVRKAFEGCGALDLFFISGMKKVGLEPLTRAIGAKMDAEDAEVAAMEAEAEALHRAEMGALTAGSIDDRLDRHASPPADEASDEVDDDDGDFEE